MVFLSPLCYNWICSVDLSEIVLSNSPVEDKVTRMRRSVVTLVALLAVCLCVALAGIGALLMSRLTSAVQPVVAVTSLTVVDPTGTAPLLETPLPSVSETTADRINCALEISSMCVLTLTCALPLF